jgi:hypothetical protein
MFVFARRIERALDVAVQRSHDADAGEHRWPCSATSNSASIAGLPFVGIVFRFRQFSDVQGGIAQRAAAAAFGPAI